MNKKRYAANKPKESVMNVIASLELIAAQAEKNAPKPKEAAKKQEAELS